MKKQGTTRSELKRQAILAAARSSFLENGVAGTSMDSLAARASVSKRTVYNHFSSKEVLIRHLMTEMWERAQQKIHVKYDPVKPLDTQLLTLIGMEIEVLCDREYLDLVRVAVGHLFYRPDALQEEVAHMAGQESAVLRWLTSAAADGRLAIDDPGFASSQLHHLVRGACFWPQVLGISPTPSRDEQRHIADESVLLFLARYLPR
jgi:TetR/AcrR family transcriptional regulator of autoinduction and epiphytic fitness